MPEKWPVHIHFNVVLQPCCEPKLLGPRKAAHAENISSYISFFFDSVGKSVNIAFISICRLLSNEQTKPNRMDRMDETYRGPILKVFCLFIYVFPFLGYGEMHQVMIALPFPHPYK